MDIQQSKQGQLKHYIKVDVQKTCINNYAFIYKLLMDEYACYGVNAYRLAWLINRIGKNEYTKYELEDVFKLLKEMANMEYFYDHEEYQKLINP